jgi:hypothetical protein
MWLVLAIVGAVSGMTTACALYVLFSRFRPRAPLPLVVIGWLVAATTAGFGMLTTLAYLSMRSDPAASMGPFLGFLALMLGVVLLVCGLVGLIHWRKFQMSWFRAFGVLMAEAGAAVLVGLALNEFLYPIADVLRGGDRDTGRILNSYAQARHMLAYFDMALIVVLLLLEIIGPFVRRRAVLFQTADRAAG